MEGSRVCATPHLAPCQVKQQCSFQFIRRFISKLKLMSAVRWPMNNCARQFGTTAVTYVCVCGVFRTGSFVTRGGALCIVSPWTKLVEIVNALSETKQGSYQWHQQVVVIGDDWLPLVAAVHHLTSLNHRIRSMLVLCYAAAGATKSSATSRNITICVQFSPFLHFSFLLYSPLTASAIWTQNIHHLFYAIRWQ